MQSLNAPWRHHRDHVSLGRRQHWVTLRVKASGYRARRRWCTLAPAEQTNGAAHEDNRDEDTRARVPVAVPTIVTVAGVVQRRSPIHKTVWIAAVPLHAVPAVAVGVAAHRLLADAVAVPVALRRRKRYCCQQERCYDYHQHPTPRRSHSTRSPQSALSILYTPKARRRAPSTRRHQRRHRQSFRG